MIEILPEGLLLETMAYLDGEDLYSALRSGLLDEKLAENSVFIRNILQREQLPGSTLQDFVEHMKSWGEYKNRLKAELYKIVFEKEGGIVPGKETEFDEATTRLFLTEEKKESVRSFLRDAIFNFTNRSAGADQWYETLPLGPGTSFEFALNLTANMRRLQGSWTEYEDGDGTRILPSWLSTKNYRKEYGFFLFFHPNSAHNVFESNNPFDEGSTTNQNTPASPYLKVHDLKGEEYYVPGSCRSEPVLLTGALHRAASGLNMYTRILQRTLQAGSTKVVNKVLSQDMLPPFARHHSKNQVLPQDAAMEMEERASLLLSQAHSVDQAMVWSNANQVLLNQQRKEWNSISLSLWKLCKNVYGPDLTPSLENMFIDAQSSVA